MTLGAMTGAAVACRWLYAWPGKPAMPLLTSAPQAIVKLAGDS